MSKFERALNLFSLSLDVKTYYADSARPVILFGADEQIALIALTRYLRTRPHGAFIMEKGQPLPRAFLLAEEEGAGVASRLAKARTKT